MDCEKLPSFYEVIENKIVVMLGQLAIVASYIGFQDFCN